MAIMGSPTKKATRRGLTDVCGGRFAIVPADIADDSDISDGAFRLFCVLAGRMKKADGQCKMRLATYARRRGVSRRQVQRWRLELEVAGFIQQLGDDNRMIQTFLVNRDPVDRKAARLGNQNIIAKRHAKKRTRASLEPQLALKDATLRSHTRCDTDVAQEQELEQDPLVPRGDNPALGDGRAEAALQAGAGGKANDWHPTPEDVDQLARLRRCSLQDAWVEVIDATPVQRLELRLELLRWRSVA